MTAEPVSRQTWRFYDQDCGCGCGKKIRVLVETTVTVTHLEPTEG